MLAVLEAHVASGATPPDIHAAALGAVSELVVLDVQRQDEAVSAGALGAAVRALRQHGDDDVVDVAKKGTRAMRWVCCCSTTRSSRRRRQPRAR